MLAFREPSILLLLRGLEADHKLDCGRIGGNLLSNQDLVITRDRNPSTIHAVGLASADSTGLAF